MVRFKRIIKSIPQGHENYREWEGVKNCLILSDSHLDCCEEKFPSFFEVDNMSTFCCWRNLSHAQDDLVSQGKQVISLNLNYFNILKQKLSFNPCFKVL